MTELDRTWAKSQIEAMADGSLPAEAERRMRILMNCDPEIREAVERARSLRLELRRLAHVRTPGGMLGRLWSIPSANRRHRTYWIPATAVATIAAVALGSSLWLTDRGPSAEDLARQEAMQDFTIAMMYLQKSALMARNEVNEAVGSGMLDAWTVTRDAIGQADDSSDKGEQDDVD